MRLTTISLIITMSGLGMMQTAWAGSPSAMSQGWTGCYVGGNAGGAWSHTDVVDEISGSPIATLDASAVAGGGQVGCDYQFASQWVFGVQGMVDATGLSASYTETNSLAPLYPYTLSGKIPWVGTVTGRLGFLPAPSWMLYAKGGVAWNHTSAQLLNGGTPLTQTSFGQTGLTAGLGAEWKVSQPWSFFAEYDYMNFAPTTVRFPGTGDLGNAGQIIQAVMVGVNVRFGGGKQ